jgi:hypothetical protein
MILPMKPFPGHQVTSAMALTGTAMASAAIIWCMAAPMMVLGAWSAALGGVQPPSPPTSLPPR